MEKMGLNEIREEFLSFFESKNHFRRQSYSLVPENDKSLLLINAGMAPLKPYFAGLETPPSKRMTTCQKCIRTGDIENVGYTDRHGTFFEMMGNFSFGDYFKKEAISWAWEFITEHLHMPEERLWATVYQDDDEAYDLWKNMIGLPEERIVRLGKEDNFWEIGSGPCGPCSEIYFDRGEAHGCGSPDCKPGCECDRYVEFWNLVFTQFDRDDDGNYSDLPHPNIDTGLGLERMACVMQDTSSIFDVDTVKYIREGVEEESGVRYCDGEADTDVSVRIVTDHLRSMTFMISDGILPGNEGRDYVLRKIIRRAVIHGRKLGITKPFLHELCGRVVETSGGAYPELREKEEYIRNVIRTEEDRFASTLNQGLSIINKYIEELSSGQGKVLDGEKAFKLHDTYGFPIDLTREILADAGMDVDYDGFVEAMEKQKERARTAQQMDDAGWNESLGEEVFSGETVFTGYEKHEDECTVLAVTKDDEFCRLSLDRTPFYAESGGQSWDTGYLYGDGNAVARVISVTKLNKVFVHKVEILEGAFAENMKVKAVIDSPRRNRTAINHTATHLLHKALRTVLGDHVKQAGSSVTEDGLRFDFNHYQALTADELARVEQLVNEKICEFIPVTTEVKPVEEAFKEGATALFGEKYGSEVRVVSAGNFSKELCGGTHVNNTGEIGAFKITGESGVASGVRRIEAVTGMGVLALCNRNEDVIRKTSDALKSNPDVLAEKAASVLSENKALRKEVEELKKAAMSEGLGSILEGAETIGDVKLVLRSFDDMNIGDLRGLSDEIKASEKGVIMVFASVSGSKVTFLVSVTDDLVEKGYHAGKMIKEIAAAAGGGGGGKADMAQAGAKDPSRIQDAFDKARNLLVL
ncbi:MAG: alanine--tRNA ligase [Clostridiales bacterium]|nr:alanine--tRNA ligase [Clostridiales bacterium]MDD7034758.1 alanine--tRNA ligase [Bacillota bacterium]MDY2919804.1 alanine--tRNA ligase [Lentihominibacter sp.]